MRELINGYPVIASWLTPVRSIERAGRYIVVDRGPREGERFVVAWQGLGDQYWSMSGYCDTLAEAFQGFVNRIETELQRKSTV
jgi:hypothetical protein